MRKRTLKVPKEHTYTIKNMWQTKDGFYAKAAPGYCFDTLDGYILFADSEEELLSQLHRAAPEQYDVLDMTGSRQSTVDFGEACKLLRELRSGYSIVSHTTGQNFEVIQSSVHRRRMAYHRMELRDGTVSYHTDLIHARVHEQTNKDGTLSLIPVDGALAVVQKDWVDMPVIGLDAFVLSLEQQLNRDVKRTPPDQQPALAVVADREHPFMVALMDLFWTCPEKVTGLIEAIPVDGAELNIIRDKRMQPPYMTAFTAASKFLLDHGYTEAARFLDCGFEP